MGRDTIQLETAVSTIFQEYLLEFTSEYGISEDVHPKLPGLKDRIVDFSEGKVSVFFWVDERVFPTVVDWRTHALKDEMPAANTYSRSDVVVLNTRRTPIQKQPEFLLCLVRLSRRYYLGDDVYPIFLHDDDRDMDLFNLISAPNPSKVKTSLHPRAAHEVPVLMATVSRVIDMEDPDVATESSRTSFVVEKSPLDFDNENPASLMTYGAMSEVREKEVAALEPRMSKKRDYPRREIPTEMRLAAGATFIIPADTKRVNDPDPLSYAEPQPHPEQSMTQSYEIPTENVATVEVQDTRSAKSAGSGKSTSSPSMVGSPRKIYQPGWGVTNSCRLDTPDACQDVAMGSQLRLHFEQEVRLLKKSIAQIARQDQRIQVKEEEIKKIDQEIQSLQNQTSDLKTLLKAETDMKKARRLKITEAVSTDVVSAWIAKGMSEELKYGLEHKNANLDLEAIEAYDPEAETKYVAALYDLRDLKYPMVDQLKLLKDALIDVVMASLHLESESGKDAPQWIRELRPSSSQLKSPCFAILLADAATQTKTSGDGASPRLLRSNSLPVMYNLD
nr:hypothetical protein [Tanacetum cinerariifolium]